MITVYSVGQPLALNFFVNGLSCLSTDEVKLPFYKGTCLKQPNLTLFYLIFTYLAQELNNLNFFKKSDFLTPLGPLRERPYIFE